MREVQRLVSEHCVSLFPADNCWNYLLLEYSCHPRVCDLCVCDFVRVCGLCYLCRSPNLRMFNSQVSTMFLQDCCPQCFCKTAVRHMYLIAAMVLRPCLLEACEYVEYKRDESVRCKMLAYLINTESLVCACDQLTHRLILSSDMVRAFSSWSSFGLLAAGAKSLMRVAWESRPSVWGGCECLLARERTILAMILDSASKILIF